MGCCLRKKQNEADDKIMDVKITVATKNDLEEKCPEGQMTVVEDIDPVSSVECESSPAVRLAKQRATKDAKRRSITLTSYERSSDYSDEPLSPGTAHSVGARMAARRASKDKCSLARRVSTGTEDSSEKAEKLLDDAGIKSVRSASKDMRNRSKGRSTSKDPEFDPSTSTNVSNMTVETIC